MALYRFEKRMFTSLYIPLRWDLWWRTALQRTNGLYLEQALFSLFMNKVWIAADVTASPSIKFLSQIPGWEDPGDEQGTPLKFQKLSPSEEKKELRTVPFELLKQLLEHCEVPQQLPRKNRREAERAFRSIEEHEVRKKMKGE